MTKPRSLRLAKERLAELLPAELSSVAGGVEIVSTPTHDRACAAADALTAALIRNSYTCTFTCLCS